MTNTIAKDAINSEVKEGPRKAVVTEVVIVGKKEAEVVKNGLKGSIIPSLKPQKHSCKIPV